MPSDSVYYDSGDGSRASSIVSGMYDGINDGVYWSYTVVSESPNDARTGRESSTYGSPESVATRYDSEVTSSDDSTWSVPVSKYIGDGSSG